jgi:fatty acid desaturase
VSSWLAWFRRMSTTERVVVVLVALALTLGAIELVRREVALHRRSAESWWRVDAAAAGALFTALAALGAWLSLAIDRAPTEGLVGVLAWIVVMLYLLVADDRMR